MKQACAPDEPIATGGKKAAKTKANPKPPAPRPECTTADGTVLAYLQTDDEKRACTKALLSWYKMQQKIQADAGTKRDSHPASGKPPKTAGWP